MSTILYCSIITTKEKQRIAESINYSRFKMEIKQLLPLIEKGIVSDSLEFDDNYLTYIRLKEITILTISPKKLGTEKPSNFLELVINKIANIYGGLKQLNEKITKSELCLQDQLGPQIENTIREFNSNKEVLLNLNNDVHEIRQDLKTAYKQAVNNVGTLDEALITAEKLKDNAKVYNKNANTLKKKTACCGRPCVIKLTIIIVIFVSLAAAYLIFAFIRCGNINILCNKE
jgi:hypothetical protein